MLGKVRVIAVDLLDPPDCIEGLEGYDYVKALIKLGTVPVVYLDLPIYNGQFRWTAVVDRVVDRCWHDITSVMLRRCFDQPVSSSGLQVVDFFDLPPVAAVGNNMPFISVVLCTRDRTEDARVCLRSVEAIRYPSFEVLVIDNAPADDATQKLVANEFPNFRYIREERPGLDWARNRGAVEAQGDIVAYIDDDVVVDECWLSAVANAFTDSPEVMAVTGLVVPYELETEAQLLFENYGQGGFGRGFNRRWVAVDPESDARWALYGTGQYGTGANMAFRRRVFEHIGLFDPALDVGTVTNGGGDLEMFFRVLVEGYVLVYEPAAMVFHRHRREMDRLRTQIQNNGIGFISFIQRSMRAYPEERKALGRLTRWVYWNMYLRRLILAAARPGPEPASLVFLELWGAIVGRGRYRQAKDTAREITDRYGAIGLPQQPGGGRRGPFRGNSGEVPVRRIDISQPIRALQDIAEFPRVFTLFTSDDVPVGGVTLSNAYNNVSSRYVRDLAARTYGLKALEKRDPVNSAENALKAVYKYRFFGTPGDLRSEVSPPLPEEVTVSVVVATLDRPFDLENCLTFLKRQKTKRDVEIIVVDNNPRSGKTPPVVGRFDDIVLVQEFRKGLSYARNAGILAASGDIIIATDDDVTPPPDWIELLIAPFARHDVMAVTGNVLPQDLSLPAQRPFEDYGGLGRGDEPFEADRNWFLKSRKYAARTWEIGTIVNAAFRASIFNHPKIGLLDEALGPGLPSGAGEDTYLFYKILKAGYSIVYRPQAFVWHRHTMAAPYRQIHYYSRGHVAYNLTTWLKDGDFRGLYRVMVEMPAWLTRCTLRYIKRKLLRQRPVTPFRVLWAQISGHLAGPWALWVSRRRVRRQGRSSNLGVKAP